MNPPLSVRISLALASVSRILSLWLFDDLLYAVIPILVLATITTLLGETFHDFLQIKEWSFATIVLFGVSIRRLIRLKVQIQQTSHSYKLERGSSGLHYLADRCCIGALICRPYTPPFLNGEAFNCPHCQAYSNRVWGDGFMLTREGPSKIVVSRGIIIFKMPWCAHTDLRLTWPA
jgi:hypothetical protein